MAKSETEVLNLSTGERRSYSCSPYQAVLCAYAQAHGDYNTWNYEQKYAHLVRLGEVTVSCGDWSAMQSGKDANRD